MYSSVTCFFCRHFSLRMQQQVRLKEPRCPFFPGYAYIQMWQYLPQTTCDTSHDHELRPLAA
ncbi:hypothetical protein Hanom_Chr04g00291521 [Helianthus anomalus]